MIRLRFCRCKISDVEIGVTGVRGLKRTTEISWRSSANTSNILVSPVGRSFRVSRMNRSNQGLLGYPNLRELSTLGVYWKARGRSLFKRQIACTLTKRPPQCHMNTRWPKKLKIPSHPRQLSLFLTCFGADKIKLFCLQFYSSGRPLPLYLVLLFYWPKRSSKWNMEIFVFVILCRLITWEKDN